MPTDGIVRDTALEITQGARAPTSTRRARCTTGSSPTRYREPKVRGCGVGDIKAMLETRQPRRQVRRPERAVRRPRAASVGRAGARRLRHPRRAVGLRLQGARRGQPRTSRRRAALPRRGVPAAGYGWVRDGPGRRRARWCARRQPSGSRLDHPLVAAGAAKLFGGWEGNWVAFNTAHDVALPGATRAGKIGVPHVPAGRDRAGPAATASIRTTSSTRSRPARSLPDG